MKCEKKGNLVNRQVTVGQEDLEQINRLTRREFSQEELYCFRVVLCDNDVDRQMERFDEETLEQLARMFVGKTGICDHQPKTANQLARIYQAQVEYFPGKTNLLGEPYCAVVAKAYMVRTESNRDLILEIEAGIKKEVSVGCSIRESRCSICQSERTLQDCRHRKGEWYEGRLCHTVLHGAEDAYEWSFVAVPAQRQAGVDGSRGSLPDEADDEKSDGGLRGCQKDGAQGAAAKGGRGADGRARQRRAVGGAGTAFHPSDEGVGKADRQQADNGAAAAGGQKSTERQDRGRICHLERMVEG